MMLRRFLLFLLLLLAACAPRATNVATPVPATLVGGDEQIVAAWVEAGNLIVWRQGEELPRRVASGGVIQPYIAPDGENVAFTRGPNSLPETLWVVDIGGTAEKQIAGNGEPNTLRAGQTQIGEVAWLDDTILYFNSLRRDGFTFTPQNDLYRANIRTRAVGIILSPGDGGSISISPDKEQIALAYPGTYGRQDGRIRIIDLLGMDEPRDLLFFVGVATGASFPFYPPLVWSPDSRFIRVAIPDSDLVYAEAGNVPPTRLWLLPLDNPSDRQLIGTVPASFFGLPLWSDDGANLIYLQREPASNHFTIMAALSAGENPQEIVSGEAGDLQLPRWIPQNNRFYYTVGSSGDVWLAGYSTPPEKLSEEVTFAPRFITDSVYVFITRTDAGLQLRYARPGRASEQIGAVGNAIPVFDAMVVRSSN